MEADTVIVTLMVTVPLCMRRKDEEHVATLKENKKSSSSSREKCDGGSKKKTKHVEGESKDTSSSSTKVKKTTSESTSETDIIFMKSLNSSERLEDLTQEVEGCKWDAILISEMWRVSNAEMWDIQQRDKIMGSRKFENKHGIGILVNMTWTKHINWTDYISERARSTSITVNKQHVLLMSVYFEANDMIHMGSDHRSVVTQFIITAPKNDVSQKHTATERRWQRKRTQRAKATTKRDLMKLTSSKNAMPNSKETSSTKQTLHPPHRNKK